jgi:hypothetical protein
MRQAREHVDPAPLREAEIQQHQVGLPLGDHGEPLLDRAGLADHRDVGFEVEHQRHAVTEQRVVVDDRHPNHVARRLSAAHPGSLPFPRRPVVALEYANV